MWRAAGQLAKLFATTKTQKYERLGDNTVENLTEINYTSGSYITYKCSKLIAEYLKSLFRMNFLLLRLKCFQSNYEIDYLWVVMKNIYPMMSISSLQALHTKRPLTEFCMKYM